MERGVEDKWIGRGIDEDIGRISKKVGGIDIKIERVDKWIVGVDRRVIR